MAFCRVCRVLTQKLCACTNSAMHGVRGNVRWVSGAVGALILSLLAIVLAGCGLSDAPPPRPTVELPQSNMLKNAGFEDGSPGWSPIVTPQAPATIAISEDHPKSGAKSLRLALNAGQDAGGTRANLAVQSIGTTTFPEFMSGYYRVDAWAPHADFQYIEATITVHNADFEQEGQSREIRCSIGTVDRPLLEPDVSYIFLSRGAPVQHKWVYFGCPVRQAFESRFGKVPTLWEGIDIGVGVRIDGRHPNDAPASADVLFDDLYVGPQSGNTNRPLDEQ